MRRRAFLKSGALSVLSLGWGGTPLFLTRTARAASPPGLYKRPKTLVALFQRGAMDGLMAVTPFTDPALAKLRPRLAMSVGGNGRNASLIDLDERFALHPAFSSWLPLYREGQLGIVHGVGSPNPTRSHFDAQDYMETGLPFRKGAHSGWLNRAVGLTGHEATPFRAVALAPSTPRSLLGPEPVLAVSDLKEFQVQVPGAARLSEPLEADFLRLYGQAGDPLLSDAARETFEATELLRRLDVSNYRASNGVTYPRSPLGQNLKQIALLIKADVGLEVAFANSGGWDTHVGQGTERGSFARRAQDLAASVTAFWTDLEAYRDNVVLMTMTEFGRTVRENGSGGTDHGRGSCMFVLGTEIEGGRVQGQIESLDPDALEAGRDLPVTTDFRSVFSAVAERYLGIKDQEALFPGWAGANFDLLRG